MCSDTNYNNEIHIILVHLSVHNTVFASSMGIISKYIKSTVDLYQNL